MIMCPSTVKYATTSCTQNVRILQWQTAEKTLRICQEKIFQAYDTNIIGEKVTCLAIQNVRFAKRRAGHLNVCQVTDANGVE